MDIILSWADRNFLDSAYAFLPSTFSDRSFLPRQSISLFLLTYLGGYLQYLFFASLNYFLFYDKSQMKDPKFLPNQILREITLATWSIPLMTLFTIPLFLGEVRGWSQLYHGNGGYPLWFNIFSVCFFLFFTDMLIYWIHRAFHHPSLYFWIHKPHHLWKIPTPFASHAFHPLDGFGQSLPYHIYVYLFPMNASLYLGLFVFVNFWTISIHDGLFVSKVPFVNGAAHHSVHHIEFNYNYGQYFTLWDLIGKSHKEPKREKSE